MFWSFAAGFICLDMYFLTPPDLCRLSTADPSFDLSRADTKYANWSAPFPPSGLMIIVSITIRITENASTHSLCHPSQSKADPIIASVIRISDNRLVQIQSWLLPKLKTNQIIIILSQSGRLWKKGTCCIIIRRKDDTHRSQIYANWFMPIITEPIYLVHQNQKANHIFVVLSWLELVIKNEPNLPYHHDKEGWRAQEPNLCKLICTITH